MIYERKQNGTQDRAKYPWAFKCEKQGCYYTVSATSEADAKIKEWKHGTARNRCPRTGATYHKGVRVN